MLGRANMYYIKKNVITISFFEKHLERFNLKIDTLTLTFET